MQRASGLDGDRMTERRLCMHGMVLFLFGLLVGAAIPLFANPRMALSAHLGGVQSGMFLVILGLMWHQLALGHRWRDVTLGLASGSMYVIWIALVVAAALGTSESTPIAGKGVHGTPAAEFLVTGLLTVGSAAAIAATVLVLVALRASRSPE